MLWIPTSTSRTILYAIGCYCLGSVSAQLIHIGALYTPGLNTILNAHPASFSERLTLLLVASVVLLAMEMHKLIINRKLI